MRYLMQALRVFVAQFLKCSAIHFVGETFSLEIPCKGSFNVRVGHDLHLAASVAATRLSISLNDLTRKALSEYLEHRA